MQAVPVEIADVLIGERQRKNVEDPVLKRHIEELALDIQQNGLIHAISLQPDRTLIAGWCRLHAVKRLSAPYRYGNVAVSPGFIPAVLVPANDPELAFRVELSENLRRKNLSPTDEATAIAELHRRLQTKNPTQTQAETGIVLDSLRGADRKETQYTDSNRGHEVAQNLVIAAFKNDPDVQKAKSRSEAYRIANRKLEQQFATGLGALTKVSSGSDFTLLQGSCIDLLETLPAETFHGIVTDPPYGMGADKFGEQTHALGHQYEDDEKTALAIAEHILSWGWRLCKSDAHLYMFCDIRLWSRLRQLAEHYSWSTFATPLIWYKPGLGHAPQPGFFGRRYEALLFAQKGNRKLARSAADVFVHSSVKVKTYAAQKPAELLREICGLSFFPGEHILDPCCGSGSIFAAAKPLKLKVTGIDSSPEAIGLAKAIINGG